MSDSPQDCVGVDPSLTGTAVYTDGCMKLFSSKPGGSTPAARVDRYLSLVSRVLRITSSLQAEQVPVFIEGYSLGSHTAGVTDRVEYGGILRCFLLASRCKLFEVPPSSLKKFVTGKGNAKKEQMILWAYKRWGVEFKTNDEVDAYALWRFGRVYLGLDEPQSARQTEAVLAVGKMHASGLKKKKKPIDKAMR